MKILVTGIAGFIGYHVALKLAEDGHNVYGIETSMIIRRQLKTTG